ncbi:MAG: hypothetical protein K0U36_06010, partial [Alphaproteobacteria bacterium]|nr:hypothetical protein [Alphaproteobacteria bacterium]
ARRRLATAAHQRDHTHRRAVPSAASKAWRAIDHSAAAACQQAEREQEGWQEVLHKGHSAKEERGSIRHRADDEHAHWRELAA